MKGSFFSFGRSINYPPLRLTRLLYPHFTMPFALNTLVYSPIIPPLQPLATTAAAPSPRFFTSSKKEIDDGYEADSDSDSPPRADEEVQNDIPDDISEGRDLIPTFQAPQEYEALTDPYRLIEMEALSRTERSLIRAELDQRLMNITDTLLGIRDIEDLYRLADALGANINDLITDRFETTDANFSTLQDLKYFIQVFRNGNLTSDDYEVVATLIYIFGLDISILSILSPTGYANTTIDIDNIQFYLERFYSSEEEYSHHTDLAGAQAKYPPSDYE